MKDSTNMQIAEDKRAKQKKMQRCFIFVLFLLYFILGVFLYRDYGISTDEPNERESTFVNIKYVLNTFDIDRLQDANGDLENYEDRYYGIAIQVLPALVECVMGFPGGPTIYYIRHLWTFLICFVSYICFYLMCKEIFKSGWLSLLGTAMVALYPRFFAEQFYNIKDMVFSAMVIVSMFVTVRVIESKCSVFWTLVFSVVTALTTNVRIVGAIFPVLLLGYLGLVGILNKCKVKIEEDGKHILRSVLLIIIGYVISYVVMLPILWENPIQRIMEVFTKFSSYDDWHGTIVFMGKVIGGDEIPWYYIPIWLLISLPVWYIMLFLLAVGIFIFAIIQRTRKNEKRQLLPMLFRNKYILWASLVGFLPWFATVVMHSTLYNGWRHCYFMLPPIIFIVLGGLNYIRTHFNQNRILKEGIIVVSVIGLLLQVGWIIKNHPYEMVYLNVIGRKWGADFDRDYWNLTTVDLCRYIMEHDDSEKISLKAPNDIFYRFFLYEEEKERIILEENPVYYIETYRGKVGNNNTMEGYEDYYSITIDGFRIATIFKRRV